MSLPIASRLLSTSALVTCAAAGMDAQCLSTGYVLQVGPGSGGANGVPRLECGGAVALGLPFSLDVSAAAPAAPGATLLSPTEAPLQLPGLGAPIVPELPWIVEPFATDAGGEAGPTFAVDPVPPAFCGLTLSAQAGVLDPGAPGGIALTPALRFRFGVPAGTAVLSGLHAPAAEEVSDIALADLDGNGAVDVVSGTFVAQPVTVVLGNGGGSFLAAPPVPIQGKPADVLVADLDGDGVGDLAAASFDVDPLDGVDVALGIGDGGFGPSSFHPVGPDVQGLTAGDVDSDGVLDLVTRSNATGQLKVLLGTGGGTFLVLPPLTGGSSVTDHELADLDQDGALDLWIAANSAQAVGVLPGAGDGGFGAVQLSPVGGLVFGIEVEDFDGDGLLDVATATTGVSTDLSVLFGTGGLGLGPPQSTGTGGGHNDLIARDLDGDGNVDLATSGLLFDNTVVAVVLGTGGGSFGPATEHYAGSQTTELGAADADGDGLLDVGVGVRAADSVTFLRGLGGGAFAGPAPVSHAPGGQGGSLVTADLDEDGNPDLILGDKSASELCFFFGDGDLGFDTPLPPLAIGDVDDLVAADLDGDALVDLVGIESGFPTGGPRVLYGQGGGLFGPPVLLTGVSFPGALHVADFDANGLLDVVVTDTVSAANGVRHWLAQPGQTFTGPTFSFMGATIADVTAGDFDGDGLTDLAAGRDAGGPPAVTYRLGNGDGTFGPLVLLPVTPHAPDVLGTDLDLDGIDDLVAGVDKASGVDPTGPEVFLGGPGGLVAAGGTFAPAQDTGEVFTADWNGDCVPDLLGLGGSLCVYPGRGDGTFGTASCWTVPSAGPFSTAAVGSPVAADFDGDGDADLAIGLLFEGGFALHENLLAPQ